ncbi:MAG: hypothetical protein ACYDDV_00035 [Methanoregula sp.]
MGTSEMCGGILTHPGLLHGYRLEKTIPTEHEKDYKQHPGDENYITSPAQCKT